MFNIFSKINVFSSKEKIFKLTFASEDAYRLVKIVQTNKYLSFYLNLNCFELQFC